MIEGLRAEITAYMKTCYPKEGCGLIVAEAGRHIFIPARNLAKNNTDTFELCPRAYYGAHQRGEILAVVHSHPNASPKPSEADRVACEKSQLKWYIIGIPNERWEEIEPCGYMPPLIGRKFYHGLIDCYSLIRDWYKVERKILLPDFERSDQWWKSGGNLYLEGFPQAGFEKVSSVEGEKINMQVGDVILMQVLSKVPNHAAIYLGNDIILHHLYNRLSNRVVYGGYYKKHTYAVLRYHGEKKDSISGGTG